MEDKPEVLEAVVKETVDLGLTSDHAQERLALFGYNKLEEKKENKFLKFLGFMWNPLSWVTEAAAIMAIALANGGKKPPDWQDFVGIITLFVINFTISFYKENNAGNAAAALIARLAPKAKVMRDGRWSEEDASILVPGDIVSIKLGDIILADSRLLEGDPLKIDQVDTTACLCRVDAGLKTVSGAKKYIPGTKLCLQPDIKSSIHPARQKPPCDINRDLSPLLPGLPDDLAIACLIRVPRIEHRKLLLVCKRWYRLLAGNFFYSLRKNLGIAEKWIYIMKRDRDEKISWHAFNPIHQLWKPLPHVPKEYLVAIGF